MILKCLATIAAITFVLGIGCQKAPIKELTEAEVLIKTALDKKADRYAPQLVSEAEQALILAKEKMAAKEYKSAKAAAQTSKEKATQAMGMLGVIYDDSSVGSGDKAKILRVQLVQEEADKLIFDVTYFLAENINGNVTLEIDPDMPHHAVSLAQAIPGQNKISISVTFYPQKPDITSSTSKNLRLQMSHYLNNALVGYIFIRTVPFQKKWEKDQQS